MCTRKAPEAIGSTDDSIAVVADRIFELGRHRGFAGVRTNFSERTLVVLWRGDPPRRVVRYARSEPFGVNVTIVATAKYSRAEAEAARTRLLGDPIAERLGIVSVWVRSDGSGLCVAVKATYGEVQQLGGSIEHAAGMPDVWIVKAD